MDAASERLDEEALCQLKADSNITPVDWDQKIAEGPMILTRSMHNQHLQLVALAQNLQDEINTELVALVDLWQDFVEGADPQDQRGLVQLQQIRDDLMPVKLAVREVVAATDLMIYGGLALGLSFPGGDLNLVLTGSRGMEIHEGDNENREGPLNRSGWEKYRSISSMLVHTVDEKLNEDELIVRSRFDNNVGKACPPVLTCKLKHGRHCSMTLRITAGRRMGTDSTEAEKGWLRELAPLRVLMLLLKHVFKGTGVGDVGASSLGSYPLMVLVIAFLKTKGYKVQIPNFCWAPTAEHGPEAGVTPMADQPLNLAQGPVLARADLKCPDYQREQGSIYIEDSLRPNGYMNNLSEDCDRVEKMCEVLLAVADYLSARLDGEQFR